MHVYLCIDYLFVTGEFSFAASLNKSENERFDPIELRGLFSANTSLTGEVGLNPFLFLDIEDASLWPR